MGLDTVELVMEIEDEFGISMPDADAALICSVGQLHAYVCQRLRPRSAPWCESARAFYHLRDVLTSRCDVPRAAVRPGARVAHLLGGPNRACWEGLAQDLGLKSFYSFGDRSPVRFPAVYTTVGDLVRRMTFPRAFGWPPGDAFAQDLWVRVRRIVSKQVGVREGEIGRGTRFIEDLHMD
jgi:hypothetical protein